MIPNTRYVHTNLIAREWFTLADFYRTVFGCVPVPPERDLSGEVIERGMHLRLPGWGPEGPTLEIFSYNCLAEEGQKQVNRPGFAHLAFQVPDVHAAREEVLAAGGSAVGEVVTTTIATGARVTWCYTADPEGNIIELQAWDRID